MIWFPLFFCSFARRRTWSALFHPVLHSSFVGPREYLSLVPPVGPPSFCRPPQKMVNLEDVTQLVVRQAASTTAATAADSTTISCDTGNGYDGRIGLRVSAIFVILVGSLFGKKTILLEDTNLTIEYRRGLSSLCKSTQGRWRPRMGLFHSQVLWLRGYHCHGFYPRKYEIRTPRA